MNNKFFPFSMSAMFLWLGGFCLLSRSTTADAALSSCFDDGITGRFSRNDWKFCQQIQPHIFMYYTPLPDQGNIMLGFHATQDTFGWTALALAGNGGMKGASHVVVRKSNRNEWVAEDRFSHTYATPTLDQQQDVKLIFAEQTDAGETLWAVLLPMNSCDDRDYPIVDASVFMLWAIGADHDFGYHTQRGQFHVNLLQPPAGSLDRESPMVNTLQGQDSENSSTQDFIELRVPSVAINGGVNSDKTNPYICSAFDLDRVAPDNLAPGTPVHVTRFEPIVDAKEFVHHMILYSCDPNQQSENYEHLQVIPTCQSMPNGCTAMKWAWAVGSQTVVFPEHVGLPLGGQGQNRLFLQMHYYNPELKENVRDNSGVRVYFTTDLREQEAGIMTFNGGTHSVQRPPIPAGEADYALSPFIVPSSCTSRSWATPINVLGIAHHMHVAGLKMTIDVERDGELLGSLRHEKYYDFNHQSLEETLIKQLLPGDQLSMHCHYDTTTATEDVSFGEETLQEMCYAVMVYYPLQERDSFLYDPVRIDTSMCYTAGTDAFVGVSACAQQFVENIPRFFGVEDQAPFTFGALEMCNANWYASIQAILPDSCPECHLSKSCTEQEIIQYAQNVVCPMQCNQLGLSVYPDVSQTEAAYDHGVRGCSGGVDYVKYEQRPEEAGCIQKGDLSQDIRLDGVPQNLTSGSKLTTFHAFISGAIALLSLAYLACLD